MKVIRRISLALLLAVSMSLVVSCDKDDDTITTEQTMTPSQILSSTSWETTAAKNNAGERVALNDSNVAMYVGNAYFKADGSFTMFNLDDSYKMHGDWSVPADGKTRTLVVKDFANNVRFERVVDITILNKNEFTYRIYPNEGDKTIFFDIVHTPTKHAETHLMTASEALSNVDWVTTKGRDNQGADVSKEDANITNYVGYAYFKTDGTFTMFNLDDSPKMRGAWSIFAQHGKTYRDIDGQAANGNPVKRNVQITVLTSTEFTYRTYPDAEDTSVYYDIVHVPTDHAEPIN